MTPTCGLALARDTTLWNTHAAPDRVLDHRGRAWCRTGALVPTFDRGDGASRQVVRIDHGVAKGSATHGLRTVGRDALRHRRRALLHGRNTCSPILWCWFHSCLRDGSGFSWNFAPE